MAAPDVEKKRMTVLQATFIGVGSMVGCRDLRPARRGRRGRGFGGVGVVPHRRRHRRTAGVLVREARGEVPDRRRIDHLPLTRIRRGPHRRHRRLAVLHGGLHRRRDDRGRVRRLCQLRGRAGRRVLGEGARRPAHRGDDQPERHRIDRGGQGPVGARHDRAGHPDRVRRRDDREPRPRAARPEWLPAPAGHHRERGPHLLRIPRVRRHHVHREGPAEPVAPAAAGHLPRSGDRHLRLCRRVARRVRHPHRRPGRGIRHDRDRRGRQADAGPGRATCSW